jgi:ABC-type multidrug transport system ATPase subunit
MNRSKVPATRYVAPTVCSGGLCQRAYANYMASGFITLQDSIHQALFKAMNLPIGKRIAGTPMPTSKYSSADSVTVAGSLIPFVIVISYLYTVSQIVKRIVQEKELRLREGMLIMGITKTVNFTSWIITYSITQFLASVVITLLLDYTIFDKSSGAVVWLVFFLFGISVVMFSIMLSTFFSRSRQSALLSPILFFAFALPMFAAPQIESTTTLNGLSLLSPSALTIAITRLVEYEVRSGGLLFKDTNNPKDDIPIASTIGFLVADIVIYLIVALYLDQVIPTDWGRTLPWYFCFQPSYWRGTRTSYVGESLETSHHVPVGHPLVEEIDPSAEASIVLEGMKKSFYRGGIEHVAVDSLNMSFLPNQVSVILGPDGAGKTTLLNMLTGMCTITSGDSKVYGKSVSLDMHHIRRDIGLCPQHNILWARLTCREHLEFYASLKGVSAKERTESIERFLESLDLVSQRNTLAKNLSAGQKRKLSLAIAFIGGSKVIFLDQPTVGMDAQARRCAWDLIKEMTPGRTVILTTHFMDEAEALGSNISILLHGRLHCSGSAPFLKSHLGVGYTLTLGLLVHSDEVGDKVTNRVSEFIPDCEPLTKDSLTLSFRLPLHAVHRFPALFRSLEMDGEQLGMEGFGITVTTLEEVFIRIVTMGSHEKGQSEELVSDNANAAKLYSLWESDTDIRESGKDVFGIQTKALLVKRFRITFRDKKVLCYQVILPILFIMLALGLGMLPLAKEPKYVFGPLKYKRAQVVSTANCSTTSNFIPRRGYMVDVYGDLPGAGNFSKYLLSSYDSFGKRERSWSVDCYDALLDSTILFHNASSQHPLPEAIAGYHQAWASASTGSPVTIKAASFPLDWSERESLQLKTWLALTVAIFVLIPFTFIPSIYVAWLVKERETGAKHLQMISGLQGTAYWTTTLLWDLSSYLMTEFLALVVFAMFNRTSLIGTADAFGATFLLFFLYGLSGITAGYVAHFAFENHNTAQNVTMIASFSSGFALVVTVEVLKSIENTKGVADLLNYVFCIFPAYCLGEGLIALSILEPQRNLGTTAQPLDWEVIGVPLMYMTIEFPVFLFITMIWDSTNWLQEKLLPQYDSAGDYVDTSREDPDVAKERREVIGGRPLDLITVKSLRKIWSTPTGPRVAVKCATFGVKRAEVLGLLGTNGAGKTTLLSILAGEIPPTSGSALLCSYNVVTDSANARRHLGYCPQFDCLLDLLTPREHLYLFSALRGIPENRMEESVDALLAATSLTDVAGQTARSMAAGNKRKLSLAIALIGGPPVVFLDEPSAGMDPVARRSLWATIRGLAEGRSVVLTTHHLEEAEALAHRVTIMDRGEMKCIGSLQHLKNKFGDGYELSFKVKEKTCMQDVLTFLTREFPSGRCEDIQGLRGTYFFPQKNILLSNVFEQVEGTKDAVGIIEYSITQTSLDHVFLRITQAGMDTLPQLSPKSSITSFHS